MGGAHKQCHTYAHCFHSSQYQYTLAGAGFEPVEGGSEHFGPGFWGFRRPCGVWRSGALWGLNTERCSEHMKRKWICMNDVTAPE